jgi:copper transport protein
VASAHAELLEIVPADDAVVDTAPTDVTLRFSEHISLSGGGVRVLDDQGEEVGGEPSNVDTTITVPLPGELADGAYVVSWKVVSADSHPIAGTSVFHVGAPSADADELRDGATQSVGGSWSLRLLANTATALLYGAALVAAGAWLFAQVILRSGSDAQRDRLELLAMGASIAGIVAAIVWLPLRIAHLGGGFDSLTDTAFLEDSLRGPLGAACAVSLLGFVLLLVSARRFPEWAWIGAAMSLGGFLIEGHTRTKDPVWAMMALDGVHLGAAAAWLGGLVALVVWLRGEPVATRRAMAVSRFSSMALWALAALTAAGVGMSLIVLPTLDALVDTGYGLTLITKVVLVAVVVAVGAYNRWRLVPRIAATDGGEAAATRRLTLTIRSELTILALVLATTAVLVSRSPDPTVAEAADAGRPSTATVELTQGSGAAVITVDPATAGENLITMSLSAPDGEPITLYEPPTVELREPQLGLGPIKPTVHDLGGGAYHVPADIPFGGSWDVTVRVRLDEFTSDSGTATVTIAG